MKFISLTIVFLLAVHTPQTYSYDVNLLLAKSVGGPEAVERINSLESYRMTGRINWNGIEGSYEGLFKAPNKVKISADFGSFSIVQGFDGTTAWQKDIHGRAFNLAGFEKTEFMRTVYFMSFAYLIPNRIKGGYEIHRKFQNARPDATFIHFFPLHNDTVVVQLDESAKQIIQFSRLDNLNLTTKLENYRKIDDILIPFKSVSYAESTPMRTEIELDSVEFDVKVNESDFDKPVLSVNDVHFPKDSNAVTIPFIFRNGHVLIPVTVNGVITGWFILDTGASATYYDSKFISDLKLTPIGESPSMGLGGYEQIQLLKLDSIKIGQLTLYDQTAGALSLDHLASYAQKKTTFGGLIGYDFFARFPILFDFKKEKLTIFNPDNFLLPDGGIVQQFHLTLMIPTIEATIFGAKGNFILDMGNALGLIIHKKFGEKISQYILPDSTGPVSRNIMGIGPGVSARPVNLDSMQLDAHFIHIPEAILTESIEGLTGSWEIAGNIGTKVLEQYSVLFDYSHQRVVFYEIRK